MDKTPSTKDSLESLITWMRERPHMYCQLAGELDSVLSYLHMVWAKLADREDDYRVALEQAGQKPRGLLDDRQRKHIVRDKAPATNRVLRFWGKVDDFLDIKERTDRWHP